MKKVNHNNKKVNSIKTLVMSLAHGVFICVILLASASWAWFSVSVESKENQIQTGAYGIHVDVISGNDTIISEDYRGTTGTGKHIIELEKGNVYQVVLSVAKSDTLKTESGGYCIVSAGDDMRYTVPIGGMQMSTNDQDAVNDGISFQMWFPGTGIGRVEFLPYWGTYPLTLPKDWTEEMIPGVEKILEQGAGYAVSDGDIRLVTPGDSM